MLQLTIVDVVVVVVCILAALLFVRVGIIVVGAVVVIVVASSRSRHVAASENWSNVDALKGKSLEIILKSLKVVRRL